MTESDRRLMKCFSAVFPTLSEDQIRNAAQDNTEEWDSLGSLLLARTIEEEFGIEADLALMDSLSSFEKARTYVSERAASGTP